jgi:hypothetical protein
MGKRGPKPLVQPGQVYGRLTVVKDTGERSFRVPLWLCQCECGKTTKVRGNFLRSGNTRSCGCLKRDVAAGRTPVERGTPLAIRRRRGHLRRKYGLTIEEADAMLARGCALCGTHDDLCIDHNHANGKARAALCRKCNSILGLAEDSPVRLRAAADYLEKHGDRT